MAHSFDTDLTIAQRTKLRDAVVTRLGALLRSNGLYLDDVKPFGRPLRGTLGEDELGDLARACVPGRSTILVALGGARFKPLGVNGVRDRYLADVDLMLYFSSNNARSLLDRVAQDPGSTRSNKKDPGVEVMMEHARELMLGYQISDASETIYRIIPADEDEIDTGDDYVFWMQNYVVQFETSVKRYKNLTELMTLLHATYSEMTTETEQNPIVTTETTA
jgi:hypothetical protein